MEANRLLNLMRLFLEFDWWARCSAGCTSCLSSVPKRELNWTGAGAHPGGTGSPVQKIKWCFLPDFYPCSHHRDNKHFLKGVTLCVLPLSKIYIYGKELLSHRLLSVLWYSLFASYYSYLIVFHYLCGHTNTAATFWNFLNCRHLLLWVHRQSILYLRQQYESYIYFTNEGLMV